MTYPTIPSPGFSQGPENSGEGALLDSTHGLVKRGVTVAGGQGVIPVGCVLARKTSDKKYYKYDTGGSGGVEVAAGLIMQTIDTGGAGAADQQANIMLAGTAKLDVVSGADADAVTSLKARTDQTLNLFHF